jgi:hypothetical protein
MKLTFYDSASLRRRERLPVLPLYDITTPWNNRPTSYRIEMNFDSDTNERRVVV